MNNTTKITLISSLAGIGGVVGILAQSIWILAATLFLTLIASLFFIGSSKSNDVKIYEFLDQFHEFLTFKRNGVVPLDARSGSIEEKLNRLAEAYVEISQQDTKVAGEMVLLADKVRQGHYMCRVDSDSQTPHVHILRNTMNAMLDATEKNIDSAINVLVALSASRFV